MNAKEIYDILRTGGLSRAGALGMLGNMMAESSLIPNIAQRGMTKLTDAEYTSRADAGTIDFIHDAVGYGLCQWTYHTRKQALLDYAHEMGCSVGDGVMQSYFCLVELKTKAEYANVYETLRASGDIDACVDLICTQYERPAVNNLAERRRYAHTFEAGIPNEYTPDKKPQDEGKYPVNVSIGTLQLVMKDNGYWGEATGRYSPAFVKALREFADGIELTWEGHK